MHHHHKDNAKALGVIDPVDSAVVGLNAIHDLLMTETGFERLYLET